MSFTPADRFSLILFVLFSLVMFSGFLFLLKKTRGFTTWARIFLVINLLFAWASSSGMVVQQFFPIGPLMFALVIIFAVTFAFSPTGEEMALALPFSFLIGFQAFRLPLELILHHWAGLGTIPATMTWTGQNWDIIAGILALIAIPFVNKIRKIDFVVNLLCFLLLLNVLRVVILSSPLPFAWPLETPLLLIAYFPYALIAPLFVMPALIGHLLVFRKLAKK